MVREMAEMRRYEKIVLASLNAKYIHPCPALYSLRGYAKEYVDQIRICEFTINQHPEEIITQLYRKKPDFLAFSCYIWNIRQTLDISRILHMLLPETPIWMGGPEVSFVEASFLEEHPWITGVMRGEGERVFRMLMDWYVEGRGSLEQIPGILWREDRDERTGGPKPEKAGGCKAARIREGRPFTRADLVEMDELPFLYDDLSVFRNRILYYESSRGCPFTCSYCMSSTTNRIVRFRSLEKVLAELNVFLEAGVPQVKFTDRTFNCNPRRTGAIWKWLMEHDNGVTNFHFEIEANLLEEEQLALLGKMRPGLVQTEIGVQSANPLTLRAVSRNPDVSKVLHCARVLRAAGNMHVHLDLIAGLPYEDYASMRESFREVYQVHPHELQLGFLKLLGGCELQRRSKEYGINASPYAPYEVLSTRWLDHDALLRLKEVERVLEIFYNSGQFTCTIRALETFFPDPLALYEALADDVLSDPKGIPTGSRLALMQQLRTFACRVAPHQEQQWNERTILDLYLRENAKTRPAWAEDPLAHRDALHAFWEKEERTGALFPECAGMHARSLRRMFPMERFTCILPEILEMAGAGPERIREASAGTNGRKEQPSALWVLFDYRRRDPVTGNAKSLFFGENAQGRIFFLVELNKMAYNDA